VYAPLPDCVGGGAIVDLEDGRVVVLDERLGRRDRNAVLGHELVHDERMLFPPGTPSAFVAKEELYVNREVARRLVPLDELEDLVARISELDEPVRAIDVIEEFDVPLDVAQRALWLLEQRRTG
jgi:hypothetical protein